MSVPPPVVRPAVDEGPLSVLRRVPGALAALGVLVVHAAFISGLTLRNDNLGRYLARLDVGVAVFFLISGFLLYRPFLSRRPRRGGPHAPVRDSPLPRPAHLPGVLGRVTAVVYVFRQQGPRHEIHNVGDFVSYYFLLQQYTDSHAFGGIQQAWTLCVELASTSSSRRGPW